MIKALFNVFFQLRRLDVDECHQTPALLRKHSLFTIFEKTWFPSILSFSLSLPLSIPLPLYFHCINGFSHKERGKLLKYFRIIWKFLILTNFYEHKKLIFMRSETVLNTLYIYRLSRFKRISQIALKNMI